MKSSLRNMVLCLGLITLVASAGLALVYNATKGPIEAAKTAKTSGALGEVIDGFDNDPSAEAVEVELDGMPIKVYTGKKGGAVSGYAVETMTKAGFSGEIKMMVGFKPDGEIYNIQVLEQNETPGLGSKMADPGNPLILSFQGKNPANMKMAVTKDGGDVDAITASTISSRAYIDAVARAHRAFLQVALGVSEEPVDYVAAVLPAYTATAERDFVVDSLPVRVHTATTDGNAVGYAVQVESPNGYHGTIRLMVGFLPDGTINDIAVMEHNETPGFGAVIGEPDNALRNWFKGKNAADIKFGLKPAADGASGATGEAVEAPEGDVEGISGSTVTSAAYTEAVMRAYTAFLETTKQGGQGNE